MDKISHAELLGILDYNPETGVFSWKIPRPKIRVGNIAGSLHHKGYVHIELMGKHYAAHRLAWFYVTGEWPKDQIDHINMNKSDNSFKNLREATNGQNRANTNKSINKTGFKGVSYHHWMTKKPYQAAIRHNKKTIYLGCFKTAEKAHEVYKEAAIKFHGEFARF
jgi:HNH endonuclease